jgi:hypothetical protein
MEIIKISHLIGTSKYHNPMKPTFLAILLLSLFSLKTQIGKSQVVSFQTQTELDDYFVANPGVTSFTTLYLSNFSDEDAILNTNALANVTSIDNLYIHDYFTWDTPTDFSGLNNLINVNLLQTRNIGDFEFASNLTHIESLYILADEVNPYISLNFDGFDNLQTAGEIIISFNNPTNIVIDAFPSLTSATSIDLGVDLGLNVYYYYMGSFDGFNAVTSLETFSIGGITGTASFNSLSVGNSLTSLVVFTSELYSPMTGSASFENLLSVEQANIFGYFPFDNTPLQTIDMLTVATAGVSGSIISLSYVESVNDIFIENFSDVTVDLPMLENVTNISIGAYEVFEPRQINVNIPQVDIINGDFYYARTLNTSLDFLENVVLINGEVTIIDNPNLSNCSVDAICSKLNLAPNEVNIEGNTGACTELSDVAAACIIPTITGQVYYDLNCNQSFDPEDVPVTYPLINDTNNNLLGSSYENGNYTLVTPPNGQLTFAPIDPLGTLPATPTTVDTDAMTGDMVIDFPLCPNGNYHDVEVTAALYTNVRPGFNSGYGIHLKNNSYYTETVQLNVDISLFPNYTGWIIPFAHTIVGNSIVFDPITLGPFEQLITSINGTLSASTPLGTPALMQATISIMNSEIDPQIIPLKSIQP